MSRLLSTGGYVKHMKLLLGCYTWSRAIEFRTHPVAHVLLNNIQAYAMGLPVYLLFKAWKARPSRLLALVFARCVQAI